jgi:hypothetical protein
MDVWILIDTYDHSEKSITSHLTKKGALIGAYHILNDYFDEDYKCRSNSLRDDSPELYSFLLKNQNKIEEALTAELDKYFEDLVYLIGDYSDWQVNVEIFQTTLQG